jgi:hypothetical protein
MLEVCILRSRFEFWYISFELENCKWLTLLYFYVDVYLKPGFEKDMDMAKLYIQYSVVDSRGEYTKKYKKEVKDTFEKVDNRYIDYEIII